MIVEVCSTSLIGIQNAVQAGANRIELCSGLELGGLTPSMGLIQEAVALEALDIHPLIRPRVGHFTYSQEEIRIIEKDILFAKERGCRGVVIGALNSDFKLNVPLLKKWKQLAGPLYLTFHRAIDVVVDPHLAIRQLIDLGFDCILSSGQSEKAVDGFEKLNQWQEEFGDEILIMPGSGINSSNCMLFKTAGFKAIHLSGSKAQPLLKIPEGVHNEISFLNQLLSVSDTSKIKNVVSQLKS
ncbi:MAG: copper homeostasis protein CutC [Flavobacteriaceae bacterium]|nr:copper homeostasis protein CutC [Flavobacteriaceae bacterium]MDG2386295.1 copper homeostasis protein CutC [Flavobacteriaceae bacterium]